MSHLIPARWNVSAAAAFFTLYANVEKVQAFQRAMSWTLAES
jgi:hypothetical protein